MPDGTGICAATEFIPCKGIVFDKDGTLIDIWPMLAALMRERLRCLSAHVREEALESVARGVGFDRRTGTMAPFGPLASAARRDEVAVAAGALYLAGIPWHQAHSIARESYDEADRTLDVTTGVRLLPGVPATLSALREAGLPLFVVTSDGHDRTERMFSHLGIAGFFKAVVCAEDVAHTKPDPEAVLLCAKDLGVSPAELAVVGDGPQDALMARRAGARSVGVLTGVSSYEDLEGLCDVVLGSLSQIVRPPRVCLPLE